MLYGVPMRMSALIPNFPYPFLYPGRMGFLVVWPAAWDQPHIANELVHLGIAIELVQFRTGRNVGRTMARGTKIIGTFEAMQQELQEAFKTMRSEKGDEMRKRAREVMGTVRKDMQEGKSWENMMKIGKLMA